MTTKYTTTRRTALFATAAGTLALGLLAGCATTAPSAMLTYESDPLGATIYEGGQAIGPAPQTRSYPAAPGATEIRTPDVTAVWPSGAKTSYFTVLKPGDDRVATLVRPANAPGLAADQANAQKYAAAAALEKERIKSQALSDIARISARCQAQQAKGGGVVDDCK